MNKTQTQKDIVVDPRVIKALGHPLRQSILHILNARVASPVEIATELDEPLGNVSYHVQILLENGAIELVKTEPVRGALEHFYRATMRPFLDEAHWAKLPASSRRALFDFTLQKIWDEVTAASQEHMLDDVSTHITMAPLDLDQQAYEELSEHLLETIEVALKLEAESKERLSKIPSAEREDGHQTQMILMHFHRAPGQIGSRKKKRAAKKSR
jgi:DNA-binding transcriptional ArsR family regulator